MRTSQDFLKAGAAVTFIGFIILLLGIVLTISQHSASSQMGGVIMMEVISGGVVSCTTKDSVEEV